MDNGQGGILQSGQPPIEQLATCGGGFEGMTFRSSVGLIINLSCFVSDTFAIVVGSWGFKRWFAAPVLGIDCSHRIGHRSNYNDEIRLI